MANEFKVKKGLIVNGSGSTILDIQGSQGQLFSVTDQLSGSLFSVNDISGIPVFEAFSDNTVKIGLYLSESIVVSGNSSRITGSLFGTASWAQNSITASYALNAGSSGVTVADEGAVQGTATFLNFIGAGVTATVSSNTASINIAGGAGAAFPYTGSAQITGSLGVTGSTSLNSTLNTSTVITSAAGSNTILTQATGSYTSAFFKYAASSGSNARAGEVIAIWNGASAQYTDYSTVDIGNTATLSTTASISAGNVLFTAQTSLAGWTIKALATYI
jgi:hypothetical protein